MLLLACHVGAFFFFPFHFPDVPSCLTARALPLSLSTLSSIGHLCQYKLFLFWNFRQVSNMAQSPNPGEKGAAISPPHRSGPCCVASLFSSFLAALLCASCRLPACWNSIKMIIVLLFLFCFHFFASHAAMDVAVGHSRVEYRIITSPPPSSTFALCLSPPRLPDGSPCLAVVAKLERVRKQNSQLPRSPSPPKQPRHTKAQVRQGSCPLRCAFSSHWPTDCRHLSLLPLSSSTMNAPSTNQNAQRA